eukprot:CAMPEP_0194347112 /NCGR_PEP_ID=MMETSP0171-20130528/105806_1 /TAXON_ID=218684 /ORGANISM="Corethron pennatum, Strain L29A3" /LENGTH=96 /DNA_ID=CAMNT_0039114323 /DNA_START=703 /DNA_END=993 /DNA_ORIENTATION=-
MIGGGAVVETKSPHPNPVRRSLSSGNFLVSANKGRRKNKSRETSDIKGAIEDQGEDMGRRANGDRGDSEDQEASESTGVGEDRRVSKCSKASKGCG